MDASKSSPSEAGSGQHSASTHTGGSISRSCYACNSKKIRCDRRVPCSSCNRAGKTCSYPPLGPRVRRTKKTIMADMASRISSLERSLSKTIEEDATYKLSLDTAVPNLDNRSPTRPSKHSLIVNANKRPMEDILVQEGSAAQYFNEVLLSRVIEEEQGIKPVPTTPQKAQQSQQPQTSPFNALGILSSPSISQPPSIFHPSAPVAMKLWNVYVSSVEGCVALKILHLPTDEVRIYSTINRPAHSSFDNLALCFAVYFAFVVSLDDLGCQSTLGLDKQTQLLSFKVGLEQALAHGDFLNRPTLTGLQALAIYLSALRVHNHGKGLWILNGLAIRIAQTLGIHRDGERLGLSPFQSEVRRRLWWHLVSRDGRAGEDHGLESNSGMQLTSDVHRPLNVNDSDLYPDMKKLPVVRTGWTTMTFSLINIELAQSIGKLTAAIASSSPSSPPREETRERIINETRRQIDSLLQGCNIVLPQQRMTHVCSYFILRKLSFFTKQQWLLLQHHGPREELATDESLVEALEILEPRLFSEYELLKQFAWAKTAYPQYHITMYILWHLCVKPEGPYVDRAWRAMNHDSSHELCGDGFSSKSTVLAKLRAKAEFIRGNRQTASTRERIENHDFGSHITREDQQEYLANSTDWFGDPSRDELSYELGRNEWPPWATLVQSFHPDNQGVSSEYI